MNPQELIIEINKFTDFSLASKLIEDCFENSKFEEKDWLLAMKYVESINSSVKFRMCYLMFKKRPSLMSEAIKCIKRSINSDIWDNKMASLGIIKCLEYLKEDAITILEAMNKEEIVFVFKKSNEFESAIRKYMESYNGSLPPNLRFIKNCFTSE